MSQVKSRIRQAVEFLGLLVAAFAIRSFVAEPYEIPTGSMLPTVQIGDRLVISKLAYGARLPFTLTDQVRWGEPHRGDIVVLLNPKPGEPDLAKRVVALPGAQVAVRRGRLIVVPPDHVFLMGDNRDRSLDSRYFGAVPIGKLKGKAFCVLWSRGPDGMRWSRMLRPIKPPPQPDSGLAASP